MWFARGLICVIIEMMGMRRLSSSILTIAIGKRGGGEEGGGG